MAKLSKGARKALPKSAFAGPGRSFPVNDRDHAEAALMDAPKSERKGTITAGQEKKIFSRAKAELARTDKGGHRGR